MSGKSTTASNNLLLLLFNATTWANVAQNAGSPITNLYVSLHNADPGVGGAQTTNETAYTNYVRIALVRTSSGWTVSTNTAGNAVVAQFAQCGVSGDTLTYVAIGTASSGTGLVLYSGALNSPQVVFNGIQPQFAIGALVATET